MAVFLSITFFFVVCIIPEVIGMYFPQIHALRLQHHMTQQQVANHLGLSVAADRKLEKGAVRNVKRILRLADLYGVSLDYLVGRSSRPDPHA